MNKVYCPLTYVFISILIYTSLDRSVVESSPINPDNLQTNNGSSNGNRLDYGTEKKNTAENTGEVNLDTNDNVRNENDINSPVEGRGEGNVETNNENQRQEGIYDTEEDSDDGQDNADEERDDSDEDQGKVGDSILNEGIKEGIDHENLEALKTGEKSAEKEGRLPVEPQEGRAVESVRNPELAKSDNLYPQGVDKNIAEGQQDSKSLDMQDNNQSPEKKTDTVDLADILRRFGIPQEANAVALPTTQKPYIPTSALANDVHQPSNRNYGDQPKHVSLRPDTEVQPAGVSSQSNLQITKPVLQNTNPQEYHKDLPSDTTTTLSRQKDVDVPAEFRDDPVDGTDKDAHPNNNYSEDGYLDAPANNLDNDRIADKTDEDVNRNNNNNYDESSDPNANLNNKNIIDDNNEDFVYNGGNKDDDSLVENKKDSDEDYDNFDDDGDGNDDDDDDDYSYEEKIEKIADSEESKSTISSPRDDWYNVKGEDDDDIVDSDEDDGEDEDFVDTVIDEEMDFQKTHKKNPQINGDDSSLYFSNMDVRIPEGVVEYKMVKGRNSLNTPSSMVLFYTWIILIVLIAVVTLSAFRYRCKGMIMNGTRNYRNGNHGNYRNGDENKKLLENVYT